MVRRPDGILLGMFFLDCIHHGMAGRFSFVLPYTNHLVLVFAKVVQYVVGHFDFCNSFKAKAHGGHVIMALAKVIHAIHQLVCFDQVARIIHQYVPVVHHT